MPSQPTTSTRAARWPAIAALLFLAFALPANADTPGRAYGSVTLGTETFRLTHAYVQEPWLPPEPRNHAPFVAGKFVVTLSDAPIVGEFPRRFGVPFSGYPRAIGIHGVTFMFDRASGQAMECMFFDSPPWEEDGGINRLADSRQQDCRFGDDAMTTTVYASRGDFITAAVHSGAAGESSRSGKTLRSGIAFNLAFTAPVRWAPTYVATLTDGEATNSAPARTYREWLTAWTRNDEEMRRAGFAVFTNETGNTSGSRMMRHASFHWPLDAFTINSIMNGLEAVYLYEDRAVMEFAGNSPVYLDSYRHPQVVPMILQDGQWKLGE